jgi:phospholipid/cholesterol/gamma-HCH transport system substrate-binding protein
MENKSHALLAGLFTLALLVAAVVIGLWFNRDKVDWVPYEIATKLSVPGLNPQAAVRYRGLDVGKVDDITFDPQVAGQILIHISVKPDTPITQTTYAVLGYQGVTGIAYVQLDDEGTKMVKKPSSKQHIARIEMHPSLLDTLQTKGLAILEQTEALTKRFNTLLEPKNQKVVLDAFDSVGAAADAMQTIPKKMQPTLDRLPALASQADQTLAEFKRLSQDARVLSQNLNTTVTQLRQPEGALGRIGTAAEQVGAVADRAETDILPLANDARSTLRTLNRTVENIERRPQSILFGNGTGIPGPGEPGFTPPARSQ